jgi:hypothetical protein
MLKVEALLYANERLMIGAGRDGMYSSVFLGQPSLDRVLRDHKSQGNILKLGNQ